MARGQDVWLVMAIYWALASFDLYYNNPCYVRMGYISLLINWSC